MNQIKSRRWHVLNEFNNGRVFIERPKAYRCADCGQYAFPMRISSIFHDGDILPEEHELWVAPCYCVNCMSD